MIPYARIYECIDQIHEKVDKDKDEGREQHQTLHHRVVPLADRLDEELADTVQVEHLLGDHQTPDEKRKLKSDYGNDRQQRVFERMANDNSPFP